MKSREVNNNKALYEFFAADYNIRALATKIRVENNKYDSIFKLKKIVNNNDSQNSA